MAGEPGRERCSHPTGGGGLLPGSHGVHKHALHALLDCEVCVTKYGPRIPDKAAMNKMSN